MGLSIGFCRFITVVDSGFRSYWVAVLGRDEGLQFRVLGMSSLGCGEDFWNSIVQTFGFRV